MALDAAPAEPRRGRAPLLPKQLELVSDQRSKIIIYRGGYRSGKTTGLVAKAIDNGFRHWPHPVLAVEPSFPMIRSVFVASAIRLCREWKLACRWQESKKTLTIGGRRPITIWCRSADAPRSLEGLTVGSLVGDEWELWDVEALKVAMARVSIGPEDAQQIVLGGTPEGFGPGYELLEANRAPTTNIIVSRTRDNRFVRKSYEADMRSRLSDAEGAEKLDGERTAPEGRVYTRFDRGVHCKAKDVRELRRWSLEVWCDFNVSTMAWAFVLVSEDRRRFHVVGEIVGKNTDSQKQAAAAKRWVREWCLRNGRAMPARMKAVCDASGDERSAITPLSHVANLQEAGFDPQFGKMNPRVEDRIATLQKTLGGRVGEDFFPVNITFDEQAAPYIVRCIANQPKNPDGSPNKDPKIGLDHGADAIGYGVFWHCPAYRPAANGQEDARRQMLEGR